VKPVHLRELVATRFEVVTTGRGPARLALIADDAHAELHAPTDPFQRRLEISGALLDSRLEAGGVVEREPETRGQESGRERHHGLDDARVGKDSLFRRLGLRIVLAGHDVEARAASERQRRVVDARDPGRLSQAVRECVHVDQDPSPFESCRRSIVPAEASRTRRLR